MRACVCIMDIQDRERGALHRHDGSESALLDNAFHSEHASALPAVATTYHLMVFTLLA